MARGFIDKAGKAIKKFFSKKKGKLITKGNNPKDIRSFIDAARWNKANTAIGMDPKLQKLFKTRNKSTLGRNIRDVAAGTAGYSVAKSQDKAKYGGHIVPGKFLRQGGIR